MKISWQNPTSEAQSLHRQAKGRGKLFESGGGDDESVPYRPTLSILEGIVDVDMLDGNGTGGLQGREVVRHASEANLKVERMSGMPDRSKGSRLQSKLK